MDARWPLAAMIIRCGSGRSQRTEEAADDSTTHAAYFFGGGDRPVGAASVAVSEGPAGRRQSGAAPQTAAENQRPQQADEAPGRATSSAERNQTQSGRASHLDIFRIVFD